MSDELNQVAPATSEGQEQELEINLEEETVEETVESLKEKLAKEQEARRQLTARAKIAEEKLKASAPAPVKVNPPTINNGIDEATIERKILKSQGMSDELLEELVALSKVRGKSLLDVQSDPIFIALKDAKEAESKKAKATLGSSRSSGVVKNEKSFETPGLSEEEHKEMWKKSQGR